ncbi:Uncharacterised protein [Mycobacteroides abscessus subsp. abscessus]|nr:Uncharacterised protein [Mycobacteroides abscessus subsp. abscessus]
MHQIRLVTVELGEELLNQSLEIGIARVAGLFDNPATLSANPPATHVEHLDGSFQLVVGERHHIGIGAIAEDHGLPFQRSLQRGNVVAQPGGPLEIEFLGGLVHLAFHVAGQTIGLTR